MWPPYLRFDQGQAMKNLSAEEIANLKTKKMTLHLDLDESQQKEIYDINLANATKRKAHMESRKAKKESGKAQKPTKEERLKMANAKLDYQIAMKAKMKEILNEEQQKDLDEQKARTTKIEAMLAESRGGSKGIQPTASPVEVPPPAPSGGAAMSEKSSQLSESKRMESSADTGDMVNNTTNNNNQGSVGGGAKGKPADVFDSTLNEALAT